MSCKDIFFYYCFACPNYTKEAKEKKEVKNNLSHVSYDAIYIQIRSQQKTTHYFYNLNPSMTKSRTIN